MSDFAYQQKVDEARKAAYEQRGIIPGVNTMQGGINHGVGSVLGDPQAQVQGTIKAIPNELASIIQQLADFQNRVEIVCTRLCGSYPQEKVDRIEGVQKDSSLNELTVALTNEIHLKLRKLGMTFTKIEDSIL